MEIVNLLIVRVRVNKYLYSYLFSPVFKKQFAVLSHTYTALFAIFLSGNGFVFSKISRCHNLTSSILLQKYFHILRNKRHAVWDVQMFR
jgi:hypothetical protein